MSDPLIADIVQFWLGPSTVDAAGAEEQKKRWYRGGAALDEQISSRFGPTVLRARAGELSAWEQGPEGCLALVILLDQFTRNMFRGTPEAYSGDETAHRIARHAVERRLDRPLPVTGRIFLYHPFHHSESLAEQNRGVELLEAMALECDLEWRAYVQRSIEGFGTHRDIVARFGRFPHRNRVLGRASTDEELGYLSECAERYGQ